MNKEQRKLMAHRNFCQQDEDQTDIEYTVQVSGNRVEIHRSYEEPGDADGESWIDSQHECWIMSKDTLKQFIQAAQWCIEKSEAREETSQ